jgi:hypothetical protein
VPDGTHGCGEREVGVWGRNGVRPSVLYQVRFPLGGAAYADLVERGAEDSVRQGVLQQQAEERPFPVVFSDEPAGRA